MRIKKIILLNTLLLLVAGAFAQDLHFSQFFNSPLTTNPANTGFIPDADYRIGVHYRNQWSNIMAEPYKTMSAFGDAQLFKERLENGWVGVGGMILSDVAGSGALRSTKVYGSVAYHQLLGNSSLLSAGFNLGWAQKRIDQSALKFPDQFDGKFFDAQIPSSVILQNTSVSYFDMQVGMNYAYFPQENVYINAGYSIHHVNKPRETFFNDQTSDGIIPMRHIGFVNAILKVHERVIINPNVYFTTQAGSRELTGGMNANYNLSEFGEKQLIAGLYYRYQDAVIPVVGLELGTLKFTFSYDVTTSSLKNYNNSRGASEFSLIKKGFYPTNVDRQSLCPKF
ncbi:PorP/SprF family type IX secretion system membrane protein [Ferruginibacter sp. HRS2-29]|uniref:PorP/SprF family type IX secretion system membrane protein n=1 Tax=Ferruginibacter sp. HRS2-29 TaxID=2487334 RepID=UPI0020CF3A42|nr:PorP/SprF family type IX secretion system membrane protein [Ferruginibacter sp. HRS2-29]MCP9750263.1 type IX secretion system membrane protein PorP/SprF [Ferruginibacter sp. HRS2-29]